jgi:uncharacterized protein YjbI with pentapeptide repeats
MHNIFFPKMRITAWVIICTLFLLVISTPAIIHAARRCDARRQGVDLSGCILDIKSYAASQFCWTQYERRQFSNTEINGGNFTGANLTGANFGNAKLATTNFSNANLDRAYLANVVWSSANLTNATITNANLYGSNLYGSDLTYANLTNADVSGSNLGGTNFTETLAAFVVLQCWQGFKSGNITGTPVLLPANTILRSGYLLARCANLSSTDFHGQDFQNLRLDGASLYNSNFSGVNFTNSNLKRVDINGTNLSNANLTNVNLSEVSVYGTQFDATGANFTYANFTNSVLGATLQTPISPTLSSPIPRLGITIQFLPVSMEYNSSAHLIKIHFPTVGICVMAIYLGQSANLANTSLYLSSGDLNQLNLTGINFSGSQFTCRNGWSEYCSFSGTTLTNANLTNTDFTYVSLPYVKSGGIIGTPRTNYSWALRSGYLLGSYADLSGANLNGADLSSLSYSDHINFSGADLTGANLKYSNLWASNFQNANISTTDFTLTNLTATDFRGAGITDTIMISATRTSIQSGNLKGTPQSLPAKWYVRGVFCRPDANFTSANFNGVDLSNIDLSNANFSGAILTSVGLTNTILTNTNFNALQATRIMAHCYVTKQMATHQRLSDSASMRDSSMFNYRVPT